MKQATDQATNQAMYKMTARIGRISRSARDRRAGPAVRSHGLSLTDLMVGMTIGLLATLVILKVSVLFETQRKSTTGIADAQMNASQALASLTRQLRMAGHGLGPPEVLGCTVRTPSANSILSNVMLWPVMIINGVDGAPDTLLVFSSGKAQSLTAARLIADYAVGSDALMVNSTLEMRVGDWLLLHESGNPQCPMFRITEMATGAYRVRHAPLSSEVVSAASYRENAAVINLGGINYQRYTVNAQRQLIAERYRAADDTWQAGALASDVVSLQAQFGYDARTSPAGAPRVTHWRAAMMDANGNGTTGDIGDLRRILAVRIALVARSTQISDQGCNASVPSWWAANETTGVMEDTPIPVVGIADWACFRYRVLQTEIPLRNLIWSDA